MQFTVDVELRKFALELANKAYRTSSGMTSTSSVGGTLTTSEVVDRAESYFKFLKGERNG